MKKELAEKEALAIELKAMLTEVKNAIANKSSETATSQPEVPS